MRRTAAALTLCLALCGAARAADGRYRDATWRFQIDVAEGWTAKPLPVEGDSFRLLIEGPKPLSDHEVCLVHVEGEPLSRTTPQAELDRSVRDGVFGPVEPRVVDLDRAGDVAKDEVVDLNGRAARLVELSQKIPSTGIWTYTLRFRAPGRLFRAFCTAHDEHYAAFRPVFERMLHSLEVRD